MQRFVLVSCAVLALAPFARPNVIVVAPSGGDFTQMQAAVDAAVDGDTLLVKSGTYATFSIANKALTVIGDTGATVDIVGGVRARNLDTGKTLVIANLHATGDPIGTFAARYGLNLSDNFGHVRVERCTFTGSGAYPTNDGARVFHCSDVSFAHCTLRGGDATSGASPDGAQGGDGIDATESTVTCYDSQLIGGAGQAGSMADGGAGGDGCRAIASELFASGCAFSGGAGGESGGDGLCFTCSAGGHGGAGIEVSAAIATRLLDCTAQGGTGGALDPDECCSDPGFVGAARVGSGYEDLPGPSRHLSSPTPVRELTTTTIDFTGTPGEQVILILARTTAHLYADAESGVELVGLPMRLIPMGTVPASGVLTKSLSIFGVGSVPAVRIYLQAFFTDPQFNSVLSGPSTLVVLNQTF